MSAPVQSIRYSLDLTSFPAGGVAVVFGASGGIGSAIARVLEETSAFVDVVGLSRRSVPIRRGFCTTRARRPRRAGGSSMPNGWRAHSPSTQSARR
jgi:hypothetical protein